MSRIFFCLFVRCVCAKDGIKKAILGNGFGQLDGRYNVYG